MIRRTAALVILLLATAASAAPVPPAEALKGTSALPGLLTVHADKAAGRVLIELPPPGADGVSTRLLYVASLRTGIGSAPLGLDHTGQGETRILAIRRIGGKVAFDYENPRFRATGGTAAEQQAARDSFAFTTIWVGEVAANLLGGGMLVDVAGFLTRDVLGVAQSLKQAGGYRLEPTLSVADAAASRVFPDNVELEARQTYVSDTPGEELRNIAPDARQIGLTVRHSFIRLPDAGYRARRHDPRMGGFAAQVVDYGAPLGQDVVYDLAERFRLDKLDPAAPRSRVRKPIVFYIDRAAPEPIRTALADGVGWWAQAFDAAGYIDAFQVRILPEGADPLDVRYNVVNWVNRATRGWSYGQVVADPRTGEIVKGSVLLGSLRVRQDMLIFEALAGAAKVGSGAADDPVQIALARIRQLGAHEVGHALGLEHNFAASTQERASVMDYPAPRIGLKDGAPDLSDAYGVGIGRWDMASIDWLYGTDDDRLAQAKAAAAAQAGLRFVGDGDARAAAAGQPWGSLWDDGGDPAAELVRMLGVRRAAIERFGLAALRPGEPVAALRRKFVPLWLLHRYQTEAAAKLVGGVATTYAVNDATSGSGAATVPADAQRAAFDALLATLSAETLTVPTRLLPLLSAGKGGSDDRQFDIELFATAGGPVFDPLAAADAAAAITLDALLAPPRLARLAIQHDRDPAAPGPAELIDRLLATTLAAADGATGRRIAWRTLLSLAAAARDPATAPEVTALIEDRLERTARLLERARGDDLRRGWSRALARLLDDRERLDRLLAEPSARAPKVPPGMPIGSGEMD